MDELSVAQPGHDVTEVVELFSQHGPNSARQRSRGHDHQNGSSGRRVVDEFRLGRRAGNDREADAEDIRAALADRTERQADRRGRRLDAATGCADASQLA